LAANDIFQPLLRLATRPELSGSRTLCIYRLDGFSGSERAYMCEKNAAGQGIRAAKNEKHPA
jgi:hypothetical protein